MKSFAAVLLSLLCLASAAQGPALQSAHASGAQTPRAGNIRKVTVGQSLTVLNGPWKFSIGDSPIDTATQRQLWAEPGFDDSHWETVDLTPPEGSFDHVAITSSYSPGWTARGHRGYTGYGWYRMTVKVEDLSGEGLAMAGPDDVDDIFQIFANGTLLGSFGDFSSRPPTTYQTEPTYFPIPKSAITTAGDGTVVFAIRVWMTPSTLLISENAGGLHNGPILGATGAIAAKHEVQLLQVARGYGPTAFLAAMSFLLAVTAFSLSFIDRSDKVYYWIAGAYFLTGLRGAVVVLGSFGQFISAVPEFIWIDVLAIPLALAAWVMVWWVWFQLKRPAWLPRLVAVLTPVQIVCTFLGDELVFGLIQHSVAVKFHLFSAAIRLVFLALLVLIVVLGVRQKGREGWIALPAVLILGVALFQSELIIFHFRSIWFPFGLQVTVGSIASVLMSFVLSVLLLRRLSLSLRAQRERTLDFKQAAEVQQVILPESRTLHPGLTVETEYRPAREVGGDFFQVVPHATDGSLLIVAGDVAGKGLQAGMLVALLVGAIRSTAELNPDPLFVLEALNRRLIGRRSAQATAAALRIGADGSALLANAGHIPPYVNGKPLEMEGSVPLGILDGAEFSVLRFHLHANDRLVLISDGVLEASGADGELFGFDRVAELLRNASAVKTIADAAQHFGQNDDISLVAVTRTA